MMEISEIATYIIQLAPAITALIGVVVSLVVGIKKIKASNEETITNVKQLNKEVLESNKALTAENKALKAELNKTLKRVSKVYDKSK